MIVTMLLGGLWHGASLTFVLWGGYHRALLCLLRKWDGVDRHPYGSAQGYGRKLGRVFVKNIHMGGIQK
jgi:D-alanyl-lipoteichoic acid acyltransferase DltB (MBOAT superfamily)